MMKETHIDDLYDMRPFKIALSVDNNLLRHSCSEALIWCEANQSGLRKIPDGSKLEYLLHSQRCIEMIRSQRHGAGFEYFRAHLMSSLKAFPNLDMGDGSDKTIAYDIRCLAGAFAFESLSAPTVKPYKHFFSEQRWRLIRKEFWRIFLQVYGFPEESFLSLLARCGLTCLKTKVCCQSEVQQREMCPVCRPSFCKLASRAPISQRQQSVLQCSISGSTMDAENFPLAFPGGTVYSSSSLKILAAQENGVVRCPKSGETVQFADLRKVYIL